MKREFFFLSFALWKWIKNLIYQNYNWLPWAACNFYSVLFPSLASVLDKGLITFVTFVKIWRKVLAQISTNIRQYSTIFTNPNEYWQFKCRNIGEYTWKFAMLILLDVFCDKPLSFEAIIFAPLDRPCQREEKKDINDELDSSFPFHLTCCDCTDNEREREGERMYWMCPKMCHIIPSMQWWPKPHTSRVIFFHCFVERFQHFNRT